MNVITSFGPSAPVMVVGQSFDGSVPPLGLGEPFALRGGDRLDPSGIAFDIMHEHQPDFLRWVSNGCRDQLAEGHAWFKAPPIALTGPSGAGRTHAARRLAAAVGVPHVVLNLTDPLIARSVMASRGLNEALWASSISIAMAAAQCANPTVTVLGGDRVDDDVASGLAAMIDPEAGSSLLEDQLGISVDLSEVTWVLQCDEPAKLRRIIGDRAPIITLSRPPDEIDSVFALSIFREAMEDCGEALTDPNYNWERIKATLPRHPIIHAKALYADMVNAITSLKYGSASSFDDIPF